MFKIALETQNLKEEMADIIMNINVLEFEARKHVQVFISELYNQFTEVIEDTLDYNKNDVVAALVSKYDMPGMSTFIGNLLRLYTKSNKLIEAFMNMDILGKLAKLITNPDFNIQSDSYETFKVFNM